MNTLVIYDSTYGNTKKIAEIISDNLAESKIISIDELTLSGLNNINLLVVGSPTLGGQPTQKLQDFFNTISPNSLKNVKLVVFDTSFLESAQNFALKFLMKIIGYAAPKMAITLESKGAKLIIPPQSFIVTGRSGPLATGEIDRAKVWTKEILKTTH